MSDRTVYVTKFDLERLEDLLAVAAEFRYKDRADLRELEEELGNCKVVESTEVPPDVVTMNSRVRFRDVVTGEEMVFTLVFPKDADFSAGKLSVASPIGTAILGYSAGDTVEWRVPAGIRRIRVEELLYQPEAAGDFHL